MVRKTDNLTEPEREIGVPRADVDVCHKIITENIDHYKLSITSGGSSILYLDNLGKAMLESTESPTESTSASSGTDDMTIEDESAPLKQPIEEKQIPKQIFVAHGKNRKPLEQLEKILNKFKVSYKVAISEPHGGRPISAKVAELMKNCTSGIFIFTADEETLDAKGNKIFRPSDNVVYELGAASVLYGNKMVIFKEEDVSFASDFSDIGYISFEKDRLDTKAADLMLELINLEFMQLTPR